MTDAPAPRRHRASPVSPERRRELIVEAVLPLLIEQGGAVSTSQIARAAGIAEGTIFRVFKDKAELVGACIEVAARPDEELARVTALPATLTVRERLIAMATVGAEYMNRMTRLMQALQSAGGEPHRHGPGDRGDRGDSAAGRGGRGPGGPQQAMRELTEALAAGLAPRQAELRLPAPDVAQLFLGMVFVNQGRQRMFGGEPLPPEQLVDLFLAGAQVSAPASPTRRTGRTSR